MSLAVRSLLAHFYCSLLGSLDGAYTARFKRKSKANACVKPRGWCASAGGPPVKSGFEQVRVGASLGG